jgi:uncharacterized protein
MPPDFHRPLSVALLACLWVTWWFAPIGETDALALEAPPLTGRIVDLGQILPPDVAATIASELAAHERQTGNQIVVLTIRSLEGDSLEDFSHRVATMWKLGEKGRDNGVLLLIVTEERRIRIEVGYGLEGKLTDAQSSQIIRREIVPRFRAGDYPGGITAGGRAIVGTLQGTYTAAEPSPTSESPGFLFLGAASGAVIGGLIGLQRLFRGGSVGGLIAFLFALSGGLLIAVSGAVLGFVGALFVAGLLRTLGQAPSGPGRRGWRDSPWSGSGWTTTGGFGSLGGGTDSFGGGGGDFGGGGASGRW